MPGRLSFYMANGEGNFVKSYLDELKAGCPLPVRRNEFNGAWS